MAFNTNSKSSSQNPGKNALLGKLFLSTLYLSAFTFGGGYVIVTLMKKKFVDQYKWINETEMLDLMAIAQSSPGPIAVNGAIVVGYKLAGISGVLTAVLGTMIPPFTILSLLSFFYSAFRSNLYAGWMLNGMQAGVGAVIVQVVWEMGSGIAKEKEWASIIIMTAAFAANYIFNVNVVLIILICGLTGVLRTLHAERIKSGKEAGPL